VNHTSKVIPWFGLLELFECHYATKASGLDDDFLAEELFQDTLGLVVPCLTSSVAPETVNATSMAPPQVNAGPLQADLGQKTVRKISIRLIPLLAVCYGVNYMDRVNVGFAALQMNKDLHFTAAVYGFGAGVFFLSYAACEVPSNLLLTRFGARKWIARIMVTWGLVAAAMAFVKKPWEFYSLRFLLGMAEAGFAPGVVYYFTLWFPQSEQARMFSRFYVAFPLSSVMTALLSGPLLNLQGRLGLAGWQWLFLVEALPAIGLGIVVFLVLPDGPAAAHWLLPEERAWVIARLQEEGKAKASGSHETIGRALGDARIWMCGLFMISNFAAAYSYSFTAPLMIREMTGYSNSRVGLITACISLFVAFAILLSGKLVSSSGSPFVYIGGAAVLIILACLGIGVFRAAAPVICCLALISACHNANVGPMFAVAGSFLKRRGAAGGLALVNTVGIIGGFFGPYYMGLAKDFTGSYQRGFLGLAVPCSFSLFLLTRLARRVTPTSLWLRLPKPDYDQATT
jgi:MFS transporter, ACS family, tartrate transporter